MSLFNNDMCKFTSGSAKVGAKGWLSGQPEPLTEALTQDVTLTPRHCTSGLDSLQGETSWLCVYDQ